MVVAPERRVAVPGPVARLGVSQLAAHPGLRLSGQADLRTMGILRQAIADLPNDADEIHLQLASLEFIDVAATRELVLLASRPARPRLVLHYPLPDLLRLLRLCWPEARARFRIGATRPDGA